MYVNWIECRGWVLGCGCAIMIFLIHWSLFGVWCLLIVVVMMRIFCFGMGVSMLIRGEFWFMAGLVHKVFDVLPQRVLGWWVTALEVDSSKFLDARHLQPFLFYWMLFSQMETEWLCYLVVLIAFLLIDGLYSWVVCWNWSWYCSILIGCWLRFQSNTDSIN